VVEKQRSNSRGTPSGESAVRHIPRKIPNARCILRKRRGHSKAAAIEIRANKSRASLLPFSSPLRDPAVGARTQRTHARAERARVYTCTRMHVETHTRESTCVRVCFALASTSKLLSHSLARHRLPAALVAAKNCTLHFGNVVGMYRVFPFAAPVLSIRSTRTVRRARGFARVESLSRCLLSFFFFVDRFVESLIFLLAMTVRSSRLAETLREISKMLSSSTLINDIWRYL